MRMKKSIYVIKNKINDKLYVGQSVDPHKRFLQHLSDAKANNDNSLLHKAMSMLGKENFYYEILEKDVENYNEMERYWIKKFDCKAPNGYNLTDGGEEPPTFYGENHPNSVISNETVLEIIEDLRNRTDLTQRQLAEKYNTNIQMITAINIGKTHMIEGIKYPIRKGTPYHLSEEDVDNVQWLLMNTQFTINTIAEYYDVSSGTIKHINAGRNHYNPQLSYPLKNGQSNR